MSGNATAFGTEAAAYAAARPRYPDALFDWIADQAPGRRLVWDVGTGSGQAAVSLAERFERVHATDLDPEQLARAAEHPRVAYAAAPAHASGLPDGAANAVTVATALHWFDFDRFWLEVARTLRPGGFFCAWTYAEVVAPPDVQSSFVDPVLDVIEPFWSEGNRLSWRGYPAREVGFPFEAVKTPAFALDPTWRGDRFVDYVMTWSACTRARSEPGRAARLDALAEGAKASIGDEDIQVHMPLLMLAGRAP